MSSGKDLEELSQFKIYFEKYPMLFVETPSINEKIKYLDYYVLYIITAYFIQLVDVVLIIQ
jgi:hypothetical protein